MKNYFWLLLLGSLFLTGCFLGPGISGEGEVVTTTIEVGEVHGVVTTGFADIIITEGNSGEVKIEGQQNIIDNLEFDLKSDKVCIVRNKQPVRNAEQLKLYFSVPTLKKAAINGSGNISSESTFSGLDKLNLEINGSGNIHLIAMGIEVEASINGSGTIKLRGQMESADVSIAGSGNFLAFDLPLNVCKINISGSGDCEVQVANQLDVGIYGSGDVRLKGDPQINSDKKGSGEIKKVN